jgi:hypothetical protein
MLYQRKSLSGGLPRPSSLGTFIAAAPQKHFPLQRVSFLAAGPRQSLGLLTERVIMNVIISQEIHIGD